MQSERPKLTRMLDSIGAWWSKTVIVATLATVLILPLCGVPLLAPGGALYRAMGVLTAGSPCAVVLVPLAYVCAIATITRKGVLVKSAGALEDLASCSVVAVDKTGACCVFWPKLFILVISKLCVVSSARSADGQARLETQQPTGQIGSV